MITRTHRTLSKFLAVLLLAAPTIAMGSPGGYMFVTFQNGNTPLSEQVYFGLSQDGQNWSSLNSSNPVLVNYLGTKGARDSYILRSQDGTRFYIMATDLSVYYLNGNWTAAVQSGSHSIVLWQSSDLINWSQPRLAPVAVTNAGCTWAPEALYDGTSGNYFVYWASTYASDNYAKQRIWGCYTKDFNTFGTPFIYIDKATNVIDADIINDGTNFYRFTKDDSKLAIAMETSSQLMGTWTNVPGFTLASVQGYEGPECYQLPSGAWCLIGDHIATSSGYAPFVTTNLASGAFTNGTGFSFPFPFRHGAVLPLTADEYARLASAFQPSTRIQTHLLFNESSGANAADATGNTWNASLQNGASYAAGKGGKALFLNGSTNYASLPTNVTFSLGAFTISAWVKINSLTQWSRIFDFGTGTGSYMFLTSKAGGTGNVRFAITSSGNSNEQQINGTAPLPTAAWTHVAVTHQDSLGILYVNGVEVGRNSSMSLYPSLLGNTTQNWLGRSQFSGDPYFSGMIDDFRIYSAGLSASSIQALASGSAGALPSPWSDTDLGAPTLPGSSGSEDTSLVLTASGAGIQGTSDQGHFTYQSWTGDGALNVCLNTVSANASSSANAGIMFREDLTPSARSLFLGMTQTGSLTWQHRDAVAGTTSTTSTNTPPVAPNLRITRSGNIFTAYASPDGTTWSQIGSPVTLALPQTLNIGLAMSSGSNSAVEAARFSNISINSAPPVAVVNGTSINLSWGSMTGATNYILQRSTSSGGTFTQIATSPTATNYSDAPTADGRTYYYMVSSIGSGGASTNSLPVAVTLYSDYQQWKISSGLPLGIADTATGPDAVPVLLKYALGYAPGAEAQSPSSPVVTPARGITFTRLSPAPANFVVQASSDLSLWTNIATLAYGTDVWTGSVSVLEDTASTPRGVTVYDDPAFNASPNRFFRLQVQRPVP